MKEEEKKELLLEYYKWLDERGMLDKSLCYDPEHQTETFLELRERKRLPSTWEEFCKMTPIKSGEALIDNKSKVRILQHYEIRADIDERNLLPDQETAEAVLALCQLIQLRNAYNGDWVPDWWDYFQIKHVIYFIDKGIVPGNRTTSGDILYFKTAELRDTFLNNFRDLIEKIKPLYGIKEGGEL